MSHLSRASFLGHFLLIILKNRKRLASGRASRFRGPMDAPLEVVWYFFGGFRPSRDSHIRGRQGWSWRPPTQSFTLNTITELPLFNSISLGWGTSHDLNLYPCCKEVGTSQDKLIYQYWQMQILLSYRHLSTLLFFLTKDTHIQQFTILGSLPPLKERGWKGVKAIDRGPPLLKDTNGVSHWHHNFACGL